MDFLPPEARYGMPNADQILFNREYTVGYSYYLKQPKWVLELMDQGNSIDNGVVRKNSFRPDYRLPERFRVHQNHYKGTNYDRGHLIASANRLSSDVKNSETFLMSNMSPQLPSLNRGQWKYLEGKIRELAQEKNIVEVYTLSGPLWLNIYEPKMITVGIEDGIVIPIPDAFYKCVLSESKTGTFKFYAFMLSNDDVQNDLERVRYTTADIERLAGLNIWNTLSGKSIERQKETKYKLWFE